MQPKKTTALLLFCMAVIPALFAQSKLDQQSGNKKNSNTSSNSGEHKMNIVSVNLLALPLKNYAFQYERVINKRISVALGLRTMPSSGLPFKSAFGNIEGSGDPQVTQIMNDLKIGNFAITPEVKFYLNKKKGFSRGFFIAPYYRFAKFTSSEVPIEYETDLNTTNTIKLKGDITTHSGGLMIGSQGSLGKYVTLGWFFGTHYGISKGNFNGVPTAPLSQGEQDDLRTTIDEIDIPVLKIKADISANSVKAVFDGPWAGVRAGLTLGFRF